MKTRILKKTTFLSLVITIFMSVQLMAQNIVDTQWGFRVNVPSSWSQKNYMDGSDKVYDLYSADQNAATSIRIFNITEQITYELLIPIYEKNMLASATRLELKDLTSKNGIPGKQGIYSMDYNGNKVDIAVFYTLQNSKAYILTILVASSLAENYRADIQFISTSFKIDGVGNTSQSSSGLSGLASKVQNQNSSQGIAGIYYFVSRSDGPSRTNFHRIEIYENGTYKEVYQPKNSGNYIGGNEGNWKLNGSQLSLHHSGGGIVDTYTLSGNELKRTSDNITFIFRKR